MLCTLFQTAAVGGAASDERGSRPQDQTHRTRAPGQGKRFFFNIKNNSKNNIDPSPCVFGTN